MTNPEENASQSRPSKSPEKLDDLRFLPYGDEKETSYLPAIRELISNDLSEPYSIYVYRYFLHSWSDLCFMTLDEQDNLVGVIVCKLEPHRGGPLRGYIAMLATKQEYRGRGIASRLVRMAVEKMIEKNADEIALETEVDNVPSLRIYENLGFLRTKRLHRYYLNGNTAFRLVLYLKPGIPYRTTYPPDDFPGSSDSVVLDPISEQKEDYLIKGHVTQSQSQEIEGEKHDNTSG